MKKKKPRTRKPRTPKTKAPPVIHIHIYMGKQPGQNSKQTLLLYDKYVAKRQGIEFSQFEMK